MVIATILITLVLAVPAEWLHARRTRRVARMAFVAPTRGLRVVWAAAAVRVTALAAVAAALVVLSQSSTVIINSAGGVASAGELDRLIIVLDASKSMNVDDAGPERNDTRATRARDLIYHLISQSNRMPRTTLITFSKSAIPVVYDAKNWDVLRSVLVTSYYTESFSSEQTVIDDAVQYAFDMASKWVSQSTVVVLVSDGQSPAVLEQFSIPPSVRRFVALGVGTPEGRAAGRDLKEMSRLDEVNLNRIASMARGDYVNASTEDLPSTFVNELLPPPPPAVPPQNRRNLPLALFGLAATALVALPFGLSFAEKRLLHSPVIG